MVRPVGPPCLAPRARGGAWTGADLALMKGIAAVPRASLVVLAGTLSTFGLPLEGIALILGVDELMDMARTATNVIGNCLASAVIAKWEGQYVAPAEP